MKTFLLSHLQIKPATYSSKVGLFLLLILLGIAPAYSQSSNTGVDRGFFDAFVVLNIKGIGNTFYDLNPGTGTDNPDFNGESLGDFRRGESLVIRGGETKVYKNRGCDFTGGRLWYSVRTTTGTSRFVSQDLYFQAAPPQPPFPNTEGTVNQLLGTYGNVTNVINGPTAGTYLAPGSYVLEVYLEVDFQRCNSNNGAPGSMQYDNTGPKSNNGPYFKANFTVNNQEPLPVTLTRFEVQRQEANVQLSWETASEKDSRGYEVQVSTDGRAFRTLSFVPSQGDGTSTGRRTYSFLDTENGKTGVRYYRLRQVDLDGTAAFYGPKTVSFGKAGSLAALVVAPNPFGAELTLTVLPQETPRTGNIVLTDMLGRTAFSQPLVVAAGASQARLPELSQLPKGLYHLRLSLGGELQSVKLLKE